MVVTVLLAAAAIAVLGGIAAVSAGYGGELAAAEPSRPEPRLPAGLALVAADLRRVRFSLGVWGYPPGQVEGVLDQVAGALAERDAHIADLELRLRARHTTDEEGSAGGAEPRERRRRADGE